MIAEEHNDKRVQFDFEVEFSNGGGLMVFEEQNG